MAGDPLNVAVVLNSAAEYVVFISANVVVPDKACPRTNSHLILLEPVVKISTSNAPILVLFTMPLKVVLGLNVIA